jgi:hypothetical protein
MKSLLMFLLMAWGATSLAQTTHATEATSSASSAICEWPEFLAAWHAPGRSVPGVLQRNGSDMASEAGQVQRVKLVPCASDWCEPGSFAAMVKVNVPRDARYRVAIDQMAWIDVYAANTKLEGLMCEHSGCQPIRKIVQYDLTAGSHWVSVQGRAPQELGVLVMSIAR